MVTGCAGFIGSHFTDLLSKKYNVVGVDLMTYASKTENMSQFEDKIDFYKADIADFASIEKIVKSHKIDWIINFAAETHVDNSINDVYPFIDSNIIGTVNLLDLSVKYNVERFHHISTDEVYGALDYGDPPFTEDTPYNPQNPYSASKAASDHFVMSYHCLLYTSPSPRD